MMSLTTTISSLRPVIRQTRHFWQWLNIIFNKVDEDRRKLFGPDRACAEWLLRNGAAVKFVGSAEMLKDYNKLPPEGAIFYVQEIDATDASISHYGFPHFVGCKFIEKIIFDKCLYLQDEALQGLTPLKDTLRHLQITSCLNITSKGLEGLFTLEKLKVLLLGDLPYVKDKDSILKQLRIKLPLCNVSYK